MAKKACEEYIIFNDVLCSTMQQVMEQRINSDWKILYSPLANLRQCTLFCTSIVFNLPWDGCNSREKWKAKVLQFFFLGGGGHYGRCASGEL